jgi:DNA ligase-1
MKLIPNAQVQANCKAHTADTLLDGELMCVNQQGRMLSFNEIQSIIMSKGVPKFTKPYTIEFHIFDCIGDNLDHYLMRDRTEHHFAESTIKFKKVRQVECRSYVEVICQYYNAMADGHEGIMMRDPKAPYKNGRSTLKEAGLVKYKKFLDMECKVESVEDLVSIKGEKLDQLGCLNVILEDGTRFSIGTGFTTQQRKDLWETPPVGKVVKFKYQELSQDGVPRFPVFIGFVV